VGLERGPLSLASTFKELLGRKSSGSGLESRECGRRNPPCWPRDTLNPQKLALTSTSGGVRSAGIVSSRIQATEFSFLIINYNTCKFVYVMHSSCSFKYDLGIGWLSSCKGWLRIFNSVYGLLTTNSSGSYIYIYIYIYISSTKFILTVIQGHFGLFRGIAPHAILSPSLHLMLPQESHAWKRLNLPLTKSMFYVWHETLKIWYTRYILMYLEDWRLHRRNCSRSIPMGTKVTSTVFKDVFGKSP
jgi:hypothetical protein